VQRSRGVPLLQMAHHAARRGDCRRPVALQVRGSVNSSARQTGVHAATSVGGLGQGRCRATLAGQLWARLFGTAAGGCLAARPLLASAASVVPTLCSSADGALATYMQWDCLPSSSARGGT